MLPVYRFAIFLRFAVQTVALSEDNQFFDANPKYESNLTDVTEKFKALWPVREWKLNGYFTDEYISNINLHWLLFDPPAKASYFILGGIYLVIMTFGFAGNFLVIFLFIRCKSLRTAANTLIVNLAASDGLMTLETPIFIYNCFRRGPALGDIACRIYGFVGGLSGTVSIVTLSAISFDRYFVIKFPLKLAYSDLRIKICLAVIWLYGMTFSLIPVLDVGLGKYTYEGYLTSCSFDYLTEDKSEKYFILVFFIAAWVVPFVLIAFSYANIINVVAVRAASNKRGRDSFRHAKEEDNKKQEIKLAFVVLSTICLWFLSWTPYAIVALLGISNHQRLISPLSSMIPAIFCKTAGCINPFVYALSHPKFKSELKRMISCPTRNNTRKVWSTQSSKTQPFVGSFKELSDVEVEVVELDLKSDINSMQPSSSSEKPEEIKSSKREFKRENTVVELLCLRPTFSNRSSMIRRLSRRWSSRNKDRRQKEEDEEKEQC